MLIWLSLGLGLACATMLRSRALSYIILFTIFIIFAFQYNIGGDYLIYKEFFISNKEYLDSRRIDPGYQFLIETLSSVGLNFQSVYLVSAILIGVLLYRSTILYKKYLNIPEAYVIFLFFSLLYFDYLGVIRQAISQSIVFYAATWILRKKTSIFILLTCVASFMHVSAILALILIPILSGKIGKNIYYTMLTISLFFLYFGGVKFLGNIFLEYKLPFYTYFHSSIWMDKTPGFYSQSVACVLVVFGLALVYFNKYLKIDKRLVGIFVLYVVLRAFLNEMHAGHRVLMLFKPFLMLFIAYFMYSVERHVIRSQALVVRFGFVMIISFHMTMNMIVRLGDDPNFQNIKLNFDFVTHDSAYVVDLL
jgi:hypothetical protein